MPSFSAPEGVVTLAAPNDPNQPSQLQTNENRYAEAANIAYTSGLTTSNYTHKLQISL